MNTISEILLVIVGVFALVVGLLFIIASGNDIENGYIGVVILAVAFAIFGVIHLSGKAKKAEPVKKYRQGQLYGTLKDRQYSYDKKELSCMGCGVLITADNLEETRRGIIVKCPVCGKVTILEERPKW